MKRDELQRHSIRGVMYNGEEICGGFAYYDADEVDVAIVELKSTIDKLVGVKKSAEQILQNLLDCGLIEEWYFNGKFNAVLKADDPHLKIAELKQKLEDAQASAYAESVDAGMRERRLKRALYKALANWAHVAVAFFSSYTTKEKWRKMENKCRAKKEKYK